MTNQAKQAALLGPVSIHGFTLIELVVVIVVSSILAIGTVNFIANTVDGLDSSARRNQLASAGRTAIDRLALELHNALPNSIRVSPVVGGNQCIEFIPVRAATTYIDPAFSTPNTTSFDVVNFVESGSAVYPAVTAQAPLYAVIYPNSINQLYFGDRGAVANWPDFRVRSPIHEIDIGGIVAQGVDPNVSTVTLVGARRFRRRSPTERFFVVSDPISFCVVSDKMYRYTNYGFYQSQSVTELDATDTCPVAASDRCLPNLNNAPDKRLVVDSINNTGITAFTVGSQNLQRNSLVAIELNFESGIDSITLNHEVLTRSVP